MQNKFKIDQLDDAQADADSCEAARQGMHFAKKMCAAAIVSLTLTAFASVANAGVLIGVVFPTQNQVRWAWEQKILVAQAKANGDDVIVQFSNESAAMQKNQVESMIQRKVKVLVMAAIDAQAAGSLVKGAQAQGIKVITYDRGVTSATADYHISRNNYEMGTIQAESALGAVPCGKYAIIRGDQSTLAQVDMSKAYDKLIKTKACVNVVYDTMTPGWDTSTAQREAEAALQKSPDIKAFVVMWDNGAQAVVQALKSAGKRPGEIWVTGSDASTPSLAYIAQGWQSQTTWTPIDKMAKDAADIAHALGSGSPTPAPSATINGVPTDYVKLTSVTKANLCGFVTTIAPKGWVSEQQVFGADAKTCK
ncbi:substrate-binding domain-containing protein [Paraburkholderia sp. RCC_158]|uniref:substrate-binding domain-containing protein n=1 Tax=Paraburkholderia sp. RCC_158 TaxID=3239220 RepID=UPI003524D348